MERVGRDRVECPLCRSAACGELASLPLDGFPDPACRYFRCLNCDLTFLDPARRLEPKEERARYELHENRVDDRGYQAFLQPAVDAIRQRVPVGGRGLDFGAGPGPAAAAMLAECGFEVVLYDPFFHPAPQVLEHQYDFVLTTEVAEHFRDPAAEFARLRKLLLPDAILVVMTAVLTPEIDFASWYYRRDPTHVVFYSARTVAWIATAHDLVAEEICLPRLFVFRRAGRTASQKS